MGRRVVLTSKEIIESVVGSSPGEGPFGIREAIETARRGSFSGVGRAHNKGRDIFLLFLEGDPKGALLEDAKGTLFGNKAVYLLDGTEKFTLFSIKPEIVERLILSCRIFDQNIINRVLPVDLPEVVSRTEGGAGIFAVVVISEGKPVAGQRVSIRKGGQVVGNDFTRKDGKVSFRLLFGKYECVVHFRDLSTKVYEFEFSPELHNSPVTLDISPLD
ncbi:MAG: hypothetical protein NQU46_03395 [Methanolinea sp.]|nr:hypothetical protein [Methanolinea sp.]